MSALLLIASTIAADCAACITPQAILAMNREELCALYRSAEPGRQPCGSMRGTAIWAPGEKRNVRASKFTRLGWQGKIFREDGTIRNRVIGLPMFKAEVYHGASWLDGCPSIIMDYADSKLFPDVRDEIREVAPGIYLGITYLRACPAPELAMFFILETK